MSLFVMLILQHVRCWPNASTLRLLFLPLTHLHQLELVLFPKFCFLEWSYYVLIFVQNVFEDWKENVGVGDVDQWQSSCLAHAKTWLLSQLYETQEKGGRKKTKEKQRAVKPEVAISGSGAGALSFHPFTPPSSIIALYCTHISLLWTEHFHTAKEKESKKDFFWL